MRITEFITEAANPAQQAAIAIAKKKKKGVAEGSLNEFAVEPSDGGDDDEYDLLVKLVKMWWLGDEHQHVKAEKTLASMGISIDEDDPDIILRRGTQFLTFPMDDFQQGMAEAAGSREKFTDLKSWTAAAKQQGLRVGPANGDSDYDYSYWAVGKGGEVFGKFVTTRVPQNNHGYIKKQGVAEDDTHQIKGNELIEYLMKRFEMTREQAIELLKKKGLAEDWQKVNHHDKTDGMSGKAVKAYRRENPGSKLKTAVTTKPSKIKKGSKDASRRKSFCARMGGMKKHNASAKTKHDPDSPINKALRRWNCESIEQLQELVMLAEQFVNKRKNESI